MNTKINSIAFSMTPLSRIMHQVANAILHRTFFLYSYIKSYENNLKCIFNDHVVHDHAPGC